MRTYFKILKKKNFIHEWLGATVHCNGVIEWVQNILNKFAQEKLGYYLFLVNMSSEHVGRFLTTSGKDNAHVCACVIIYMHL